MAGIVQWCGDDEARKCGYCKKSASSYCKGMWATTLSPQHYQDLIDRGWRRSGKYCYKPEMQKTCCPLYTIRCDAVSFKPTKSHKKVMKRMQKFLLAGRDEADTDSIHDEADHCKGNEQEMVQCSKKFDDTVSVESKIERTKDRREKSSIPGPSGSSTDKPLEAPASVDPMISVEEQAQPSKPGVSMKKKDIRKQRWAEKRKASNLPLEPPTSKNTEKSLEDWLNFRDGKHRLEYRLVRTNPYSEEAKKSEDASHTVYQSYQMKVHGDTKEKCKKDNWRMFLVDSPLDATEEPLLGSFHQQYWLDDQLIAVGVLDILPYCVSSVYFYYDPDFNFLSLGTFASLNEIKLTRELQRKYPKLRYYYMGYYAHECPKMRYKGRLPSSDLLCPEAYTWQPIDRCLPLLEKSKYSRLEPDEKKVDERAPKSISSTTLLYNRCGVSLGQLLGSKKVSSDEMTALKEYCDLVGSELMEELYYVLK